MSESITTNSSRLLGDSLLHLFKRIRNSDRIGFELLYTEMADPLFRYAVGLTGNKYEAMDVVHDVFVKVWERRKHIKINRAARSFMYMMTRNHFLNLKKKSNRSVATDFSEVNSPWHALGFNVEPGTDFISEDLLLNWIRSLPPRRSEAFMLSRFHDLSHQQIAQIMDLSERTVNTHIQHALRDLRIQMTQYEASV